jgi:nickel/cobalt exporter
MLALLQLPITSRLEAMLGNASSDPVFLATALAIAFFLGAAHALTPGHGKMIVAAYLAGSRGRITDAVYLGTVVTATHTAIVFVLGIATLYASRQVSLDRIYPKLAFLSGVLVTVIGLALLWRRARSLRAHSHEHGNHEHHHHHDHSHPHSHSHALDRPGKGSLLSLGVSGGLVPCPEALVVLMLSISLRRIIFGLSLLVAFSLGLAAILIAIGSAIVMAAPFMARFTGESRWLRVLPVVSAAVVTVLGVVMVTQTAGAI